MTNKADHAAVLEEGSQFLLDFSKLSALTDEVVPAVVQDAASGEVLLLAYVNMLALEESLKTKQAVFWSTSRRSLWVKGASSGDYLDLLEIRINCEQNSLLYLVSRRTGAACHTVDAASGKHRSTCFYRRLHCEKGSDEVKGIRLELRKV